MEKLTEDLARLRAILLPKRNDPTTLARPVMKTMKLILVSKDAYYKRIRMMLVILIRQGAIEILEHALVNA